MSHDVMYYRIDPSRYRLHDSLIDAAAQRHGVSQALIKAIILAESSFKPDAYRDEPKIHDASRGLMQMLLSTARGLGFAGDAEDLYRPGVAIEYGTRYLRQLIDGFGDERLAVAAYNCGPGRVRQQMGKHGREYEDLEAHLPRITRAYVERVMAYREQFVTYHREHGIGAPPRAKG